MPQPSACCIPTPSSPAAFRQLGLPLRACTVIITAAAACAGCAMDPITPYPSSFPPLGTAAIGDCSKLAGLYESAGRPDDQYPSYHMHGNWERGLFLPAVLASGSRGEHPSRDYPSRVRLDWSAERGLGMAAVSADGSTQALPMPAGEASCRDGVFTLLNKEVPGLAEGCHAVRGTTTIELQAANDGSLIARSHTQGVGWCSFIVHEEYTQQWWFRFRRVEWVKPGGSADDLNRDFGACERGALERFPARVPALATTDDLQKLADRRAGLGQFADACMKALGYSQ